MFALMQWDKSKRKREEEKGKKNGNPRRGE